MKTFLFLLIASVLFFGSSLQAQTKDRVPRPPGLSTEPAEASAAQKYFSDVELLNQDGAKMRFYSDLLKGHTVVIIPFFSTCTAVCPPMNRNLEKVQGALGDRLGKQVYLISISVDPVTDTPPRLKEYAAKFHAKPGWFFVTGKKENVDWALYKLGQYVEDKNNHSSIMIIGNESTGLWKKAYALARPEELIKIVEEVANDKGKGAN
jgi:protein SCO1